MSDKTFHISNSISFPENTENDPGETVLKINKRHEDFERQYLLLRTKENRIYTDEELSSLPDIHQAHPHYKEWLVRKKSFLQLKQSLSSKGKPLEILEVGCGNGWLANQLSLHIDCKVTGIDINRPELAQACRVFQRNESCTFIYGDLYAETLAHKKFDTLVFAASIQYFSPVKNILQAAIELLKPGGEIHLLDTHFYKPAELEGARQRSISHFTSLGFPALSGMYFHHSLNELKDFNPVILYDPLSLRNRFSSSRAPFYHICIPKNY